MLNKITGRRANFDSGQFKRKPTSTVKDIVDFKQLERNAWQYNGNARYDVYKVELAGKPVEHLVQLKKEKSQILILGPGLGKDILFLRKDLNEHKIKPIINVFGLTKITDSQSAYSYIDKDYSIGVPFENLDPKIENHREILEENIGKNDVIIALKSTSYHTNYLEFSLYQSAIMLSKGGKAYLEFNFLEIKRKIPIKDKEKEEEYYNRLKIYFNSIDKSVNRMVNLFNKKYQKEFKFNIVWDFIRGKSSGDLKINYIEIERIN
ncbi:MAG: hypothetical protein WCX82_00465 [archaeon]|jgi:hypothetical protein